MTIVSIAAVLAILVGLNYLVIRRDKQWDLTASKHFTPVGRDDEGAAGPEGPGQGSPCTRSPKGSRVSATR